MCHENLREIHGVEKAESGLSTACVLIFFTMKNFEDIFLLRTLDVFRLQIMDTSRGLRFLPFPQVTWNVTLAQKFCEYGRSLPCLRRVGNVSVITLLPFSWLASLLSSWSVIHMLHMLPSQENF